MDPASGTSNSAVMCWHSVSPWSALTRMSQNLCTIAASGPCSSRGRVRSNCRVHQKNPCARKYACNSYSMKLASWPTWETAKLFRWSLTKQAPSTTCTAFVKQIVEHADTDCNKSEASGLALTWNVDRRGVLNNKCEQKLTCDQENKDMFCPFHSGVHFSVPVGHKCLPIRSNFCAEELLQFPQDLYHVCGLMNSRKR